MPDTSAAGRWDTAEGGGIYCTGIGGSLTGQPVHILCIDDPVKDREQAESETYRERAWDWWENVAIPRLAPNSVVVLVQTRWHEDDLSGRILTRPSALRWRVLSIPAIAGADDPLGRDPGVEFPSVRGRAPGYFHRLQAAMTPYVFASIYQQSPTSVVGNFFRRPAFRYWRPADGRDPAPGLAAGAIAGAWLNAEGRRVDLADPAVWRFATVDVAASTATAADWTVVSVWAIDRAGDLFLLDRHRARVEMADHFALARPLMTKWRADVLYVERQFYSKTLVVDARQAGIPVALVEADTDKITRAIPAASRLHAGRVWFPAVTSGCPCGNCPGGVWLEEWENELASFPRASHDDQVDTFAYAARVAAAHWIPPAPPSKPRHAIPPELARISQAYDAATGSGALGGPVDVMNMPLG